MTPSSNNTLKINAGKGLSLFGGTTKDLDQMTVGGKSFISKSKMGNKFEQLMVNKVNVVKHKEDVHTLINQDQNIDLDKIKKYFENVINERHFLNNYEKAKMRNAGGSANDPTSGENHHR